MNSTVQYSEHTLILQLQRQDTAAFEYLYDKYNGAVKTVIMQVVQNEVIAEDLLQQVFVTFWQKSSMYDASKGRLFTWMLNIARNASIDYLRSKAHKTSQKNVSTETIVYNDSLAVSNNVDSIGLEKYVASLKPELRSVLYLSYYQGHTHEEIAENLQMPLGTVKTRLRNALIELRKLMGVIN